MHLGVTCRLHFVQNDWDLLCVGVTCHLHFVQNDRDLLCATAVTGDGTGTEITWVNYPLLTL